MQVLATSYEIIIGLNSSKYCMYFNKQNEHFYLDLCVTEIILCKIEVWKLSTQAFQTS